MKGHAKIELKNVETGEVKVYEEDNLITNFFAHLSRNLGPTNQQLFNSSNSSTDGIPNNQPTAKSLFGGILLWDNEIEEDADQIYVPADVSMLGHATADLAYEGSEPELGSYNSAESGLLPDGSGYKFVFDFETNQANGTIKSMSLVNKLFGEAGFGNASGIRDRSVNVFAYFASGQDRGYDTATFTTTPVFIHLGNNEIGFFHDTLAHMYADKVIKVDVYHLNIDKLSAIRCDNVLSVYGKKKRTISYDISSIPAGLRTDIYASVGGYLGGFLISMPQETGYTSNWYMINCAYTTTNTGTATVTEMPASANSQIGRGCHMLNGYYYLIQEGNIEVVKASDPTDFVNHTVSNPRAVVRCGDVLVAGNNVLRGKDILPIDSTNRIVNVTPWPIVDTDDALVDQGNGGIQYAAIARNPFMLSTINNLDEPVVKTAAHTMKITYTLTEEV